MMQGPHHGGNWLVSQGRLQTYSLEGSVEPDIIMDNFWFGWRLYANQGFHVGHLAKRHIFLSWRGQMLMRPARGWWMKRDFPSSTWSPSYILGRWAKAAWWCAELWEAFWPPSSGSILVVTVGHGIAIFCVLQLTVGLVVWWQLTCSLSAHSMVKSRLLVIYACLC